MVVPPESITAIDFSRFENAFKSDDDVGSVVRCEYEVERAAFRALSALVPKYKLFRHRYLSDHLKTFRAFGCEGPIFQVADYVRKVRNEFAHEGIEKIVDAHITEMCSQAGRGFGGRPVRAWVIGGGTWGVPTDTKLEDLTPRQQFVFISSLAAALIDTLPQRVPRVIKLDHLPEF